MKVTPTELSGVLLVEPAVFEDPRGYFCETWSLARYRAAGIPSVFVQDNLSRSGRGTLRGLHLQNPFSQAKLVYVLVGEVYDVAVDVRVGSPTFGKWAAQTLSADNKRQLYIPEGFAHGFCVTSDYAIFAYKCTEVYHPEAEIGVAWNDPRLGIDWPLSAPLVSAKDAKHLPLADISRERLPTYTPAHESLR